MSATACRLSNIWRFTCTGEPFRTRTSSLYDGENVTFKYTESNSDVVCYRTLPALEFIRLCLQHVLPSGFQKTRYYGLLASANRKTVRELRLMILTTRYSRVPELEDFTLEPLTCPKCGNADAVPRHIFQSASEFRNKPRR